jgi:acetylornithine deacetylase/succinyl-diaminopimelate desuccinylase-like protein
MESSSASIVGRIIELTAAIQQIPAPTFQESERAEFVCGLFHQEGLGGVEIDPAGNVLACLPGAGSARPLIVSAHLDTVFPSGTDLTLRREPGRLYGPGVGDNSLGVAGLFGLVWSLRAAGTVLPGDVWLAANVCEEGLGDLRGIRAVVDRFGAEVTGYITLEGMALGQIYHRGLGVQRYRITAHTPGGHSWVDYGRPSAVHELANLITRITTLPVPARPRASLNIGVVAGGTTVNTIAAEAHMELDLRSDDPDTLTGLAEQVLKLVAAANRSGVRVDAEMIGRRPSGGLPEKHPLVQKAVRAVEAQGLTPRLGIGSTDANIPLSRGLPAVCIGLSSGGGAHTASEYLNLTPIAQGMAQVVMLVKTAFTK